MLTLINAPTVELKYRFSFVLMMILLFSGQVGQDFHCKTVCGIHGVEEQQIGFVVSVSGPGELLVKKEMEHKRLKMLSDQQRRQRKVCLLVRYSLKQVKTETKCFKF